MYYFTSQFTLDLLILCINVIYVSFKNYLFNLSHNVQLNVDM